jgi:hypothetical protein
MSAPRSIHYAAVLRILRYVKGTMFHGLHFSSHSSLELRAYMLIGLVILLIIALPLGIVSYLELL